MVDFLAPSNWNFSVRLRARGGRFLKKAPQKLLWRGAYTPAKDREKTFAQLPPKRMPERYPSHFRGFLSEAIRIPKVRNTDGRKKSFCGAFFKKRLPNYEAQKFRRGFLQFVNLFFSEFVN